MIKKAIFVWLMWVAAPLAACAVQAVPGPGGQDFFVPLTNIRQARFASTVHQQYDFSCGSAALATLLTYHYGLPVSEQAVFEAMFARGDQQKIRREGFSLLDMKIFLETQGFRADGFQQPLASLAQAGLPAIVLIQENGYRHFVVIKGVRARRVLIGDPSTGTRALARKDFEAIWVNRLLFVIHSRQDVARFNGVADWRVAPAAPLSEGLVHDGLNGVTLPKLGPGDF